MSEFVPRSRWALGWGLVTSLAGAAPLPEVAERIRLEHHLPELAYAVISSKAVLASEVLGTRKAGEDLPARPEDRFRLGSNTKAVTALIAARLVEAKALRWDTRFFSLFPELEATADPAHHGLTLSELLTFQSRIPMYTYTNPEPTPEQLDALGHGSVQQHFVDWFLRAKAVPRGSHSNPGYVAAGLMLEKASGKSYRQLVEELNQALQVDLRLGPPNADDATQTWGHRADGSPAERAADPRLDWLEAAGNLNATLADEARVLQEFLRGARGNTALLPQRTFQRLLHGTPGFAMGWFWERNAAGHTVAHNLGNPGTFLSSAVVIEGADRAYLIFTNVQSDEAAEALAALLEELEHRFGR